jgi:hypothetical protein
MKHLLNGVAIAAALAIAAPVWAQAPMTPSTSSTPKAAGEAPSTYAPPAKHAYKQRHKRPPRYAARYGHKRYARGGGGDQMTDQLNREELARIQGGGGGMPMGGPPEGMAPGPGPGQAGPRPSGH